MTLSDAANLVTIQQGEDRILNDPSLTLLGKSRALTGLQNAASFQPTPQPWLSPGDVVRGGVGAGLGYGVSTLLGKMIGVSSDTLSTVQRLGMGLGTLINMGKIMNKTSSAQDEQERRDAFKLGFARAALDIGLIKESGVVANLPLTEAIRVPVELGTSLAGTVASTGGALAGHIVSDDPSDVELTQMGLEQRQLESRAKQLESLRRSSALKQVLDKRMNRR